MEATHLRVLPMLWPSKVSRNELGLAVLDQGAKKLLYFHCLQMGHARKSELESPIQSEYSDFQSLSDCDSSLDLDVMSWRNPEEEAMGELEGSSQEADPAMELSEPLWENDSEDNEAEEPCENDSFLQFLLEVGQFGLQEGGQHSSGSPETLGFSGPPPSMPTETVWGHSRNSGFTLSPSLSSRLELPLHPGSCFAKTQLTLKHRNVSELTL